MGEINWIKISTTMFDDEKINFIESLPEADAILIIWIKLLTFAGKCNMSGYIMLTENIPYTDEMLSHKFRRPLNTVRLALDTFRRLEMITINDEAIHLTNWEKHQNEEKLASIREYNRQKKQEQRQRDKQKLIECQGHVIDRQADVNTQNIDKRIKNNKETRQGQVIDVIFFELINSYTSQLALQEAIYHFISHRKSIKKPIKDKHTLELIFKELDKHEDKIGVIEQSIINGWQGIFPLKTTHQNKNKEQNQCIYREVD